jgi:RNA ligase
MDFYKYPRTQHLQGSRSQSGDEDLESVPWTELIGRYVVAEEKLDGANAGLSFDPQGNLRLQSRGHYLTGGPRERQFDRFKQWANTWADLFRSVLGSRYIVYGEWLWAKHTIFYDLLPDYFVEFDVLDIQTGVFLSTRRRQSLLEGLPLVSVPVLFEGILREPEDVLSRIGRSVYKSAVWKENLDQQARDFGQNPERIRRETDPSDKMEGLYLRIEENEAVVARMKYVRADFLNTIADSGSHWQQRPILPNRLRGGESGDSPSR